MVRNLVDNAIHYTGQGGVVTVRVLLDRFSGVQILQVEDNGPGIPENERELVLQPFYRALGTNVDGSGLGLAIVHGNRAAARRHGVAWKTRTRSAAAAACGCRCASHRPNRGSCRSSRGLGAWLRPACTR